MNINEEYCVLHSISSEEDEEDEFQFKSRKDPDLPPTETSDVRRSFPFVRSLDFTKPMQTRIRTTIRGSIDFENTEKLKIVKKPVNPYKINMDTRKKTKGEFIEQTQV